MTPFSNAGLASLQIAISIGIVYKENDIGRVKSIVRFAMNDYSSVSTLITLFNWSTLEQPAYRN